VRFWHKGPGKNIESLQEAMKSGFGRRHGAAAPASVAGSTTRGTMQQQLVTAQVADIKEVKEELEGGHFEGFDDDWFHGGQKQSASEADAGEGLSHCPNALTSSEVDR
jgi:hypothetical protein